MSSSEGEYYVDDYNTSLLNQNEVGEPCVFSRGMGCNCRNCRKRTCNCVVLASRGACSPDDDIPHPKPGQLWIRDTDEMFVYQSILNTKRQSSDFISGTAAKQTSGRSKAFCEDLQRRSSDNKWLKVPMGKVLDFNFVSTIETNAVPYVQTNGLIRQIVRTFIFPDSFNGLGGRIRKIEYGNSWSGVVDDPTVDQGMLLIIRDQGDKQSVIMTQDKPSMYESFSTSSEVLYQPNPGDILEVVIQKPPNLSQPGQGRLHCLKIFLSPFNPDTSCQENNL